MQSYVEISFKKLKPKMGSSANIITVYFFLAQLKSRYSCSVETSYKIRLFIYFIIGVSTLFAFIKLTVNCE